MKRYKFINLSYNVSLLGAQQQLANGKMSKNRKKKLKKKIKKQLEKRQNEINEIAPEKDRCESSQTEEKCDGDVSEGNKDSGKNCDVNTRNDEDCDKNTVECKSDGNIEGNGHDCDDIHMKNCEKGQSYNECEKNDNDHDMASIEEDKKRDSTHSETSILGMHFCFLPYVLRLMFSLQ